MLGSQASVLGVKLWFSHTHFGSFSFFLLPSLQKLGVQYLLLLPSPLIKTAVRERSDMGDLWFGKN